MEKEGMRRPPIHLDSDAEERGYFPFEITAVHERPTLPTVSSLPVRGGNWTVLDCRAAADRAVTFTIAIRNSSEGDEQVLGWGEAVLMADDREIGARLLGLFADAFRTELPRVRRPQTLLEPLVVPTVVLGDGLVRDPEGGFSIHPGDAAGSTLDGDVECEPARIDAHQSVGWMATKWTPERDGHHARVFFNYNLHLGRGEFLEKDRDNREELLAVLASALRDGPRPVRTPETDPNLTRVGPRIANVRPILNRWSISPSGEFSFSFSPGGAFLVYRCETRLYAVDPSKPDEGIELVRFDHPPEGVSIVDDAPNLVVMESIPVTRNGLKIAGRVRIWWIDATTKGKRRLRGPEWYLGLGETSASPDGRYVAMEKWRRGTRRGPRRIMIDLLDRQTGAVQVVNIPDRDVSVVGWKPTEDGLRALLLGRLREVGDDRGHAVYLADPATGSAVEVPEPSKASEGGYRLSPDGRHFAELRDKATLIVTDRVTGQERKFTFHEDDQPYVREESIRWASPGWLQFEARRLALIDVSTMKMSLPGLGSPADVPMIQARISPDLAWIAYQEDGNGDGLFLGQMVLHRE